MTGHQIFQTVLLTIFGVISLSTVKGTKKPQKYIDLFIGILALLSVAYDILTLCLGISLF
jgi:hypothetical protein